MAEKPNPFLLPSQQIQFMKSMNPFVESPQGQAMRQAGMSQDFIAPWEQEQGTSPEAHPYVQSTFEQGTQAATARGDDDAYNARVDQYNRQNANAEFQMNRKMSKHPGPSGQDFTSRGPITPPANTGGDPRAVSSYPHLNENMTRDRSSRMRLPDQVFAAPMDLSQNTNAPIGDKGYGYFGPNRDPDQFDPILFEQTPTPRTPAQIGDSIRMKAQTGQPLDAEERLALMNHLRKGMQELGKTEEYIQRALSRIDPATGFLPNPVR